MWSLQFHDRVLTRSAPPRAPAHRVLHLDRRPLRRCSVRRRTRAVVVDLEDIGGRRPRTGRGPGTGLPICDHFHQGSLLFHAASLRSPARSCSRASAYFDRARKARRGTRIRRPRCLRPNRPPKSTETGRPALTGHRAWRSTGACCRTARPPCKSVSRKRNGPGIPGTAPAAAFLGKTVPRRNLLASRIGG